MKRPKNRQLYVIAGSNGAGKTTFARAFLPDYAHCLRFINPDLIAAGLSPFDPSAAAAEAGRVVLREVQRAIRAEDSFAFESTLSGRTYLHIFTIYAPEMNSVHFFDNSGPTPRLVFRIEAGKTTILNAALYSTITQQVEK